MTNQTIKKSFKEFIDILANSKEVGLVIAKNQKELDNFSRLLEDAGFNKAVDIANVFESQKTYIVVDKDIEKNVYDLAIQYPTGQVEIFDNKNMQSRVFFPDYHSTIVLLVAQDVLNKIQTRGFNFLSVVGPAYRS